MILDVVMATKLIEDIIVDYRFDNLINNKEIELKQITKQQ